MREHVSTTAAEAGSEFRLGSWLIESRVLTKMPRGVLQPVQVHGSEIVRAADLVGQSREADGVFLTGSDSTRSTIAIRTADCLPLLLLGESQALALHISRKTLLAGLLDQVPTVFDLSELREVYLGPHICQEHFSFKCQGDLIIQFYKKYPWAVIQEGGLIRLSLREAVGDYLSDWKHSYTEIYDNTSCTYHAALLPSYRRALEQGVELTSYIYTTLTAAKA